MTKVLQVVTSTDRRGAETAAVELEDALRPLHLDVETVALAAGAGHSPLDLPTLGSSPLGRSTLRALRRRAQAFDVVIAHGSKALPACAIGLAGTGATIVYRNIGDPDYWGNTLRRRLQTAALLRRTRRVVAISDTAVGALHDRYWVPTRKITVVPTGVDADRHRPAGDDARDAARTSLGLSSSAIVVATIGALTSEKGTAVAIRAIADVDRLQLVVVGDGPLRGELEALARALAPGRVHFTGALADPAPAFAAANVVALPSLTEGLPAVLIEAGLRGLPCVATDVGFVRDIVADGITGILVAPGESGAMSRGIQRALELGPEAGLAARQHCEASFAMEVVARQWVTLVRSLVATK